jgi:hypothetical protein
MAGLCESGHFTGSDSPFLEILQDSNAKMQDSKAFLAMFRLGVLRLKKPVFLMGEYRTVLMNDCSLHVPGGHIRKERPVLGVSLTSESEFLRRRNRHSRENFRRYKGLHRACDANGMAGEFFAPGGTGYFFNQGPVKKFQ